SFASNNLNQQTDPGTHVYDAKGQKTTLDDKTFEWDDQGRVTAIVEGTNRTEFAYDGMSRRTKITEYTDGTMTSKKLYWWLGGTIVCERDGLVSGFPIKKRYFSQGVLQGATKLFYTFDHLGSVRELVDDAGVSQAVYSYTTYGERTKESGNLEADFGYAGLWHHGPSGLDLATYRLYDAANKRWISRDPLGEGVDTNLYRYAYNSPTNLVDPLGAAPEQRSSSANPPGDAVYGNIDVREGHYTRQYAPPQHRMGVNPSSSYPVDLPATMRVQVWGLEGGPKSLTDYGYTRTDDPYTRNGEKGKLLFSGSKRFFVAPAPKGSNCNNRAIYFDILENRKKTRGLKNYHLVFMIEFTVIAPDGTPLVFKETWMTDETYDY
ncbi:MAG: RHS repeat-associated core domain-containing protein, partial [Candidatus Eremiobacteraeota bacterium]|nr:RHS repeat-associated core domain-containing protein [Candidatus Eremiobacteraeota bacterium]